MRIILRHQGSKGGGETALPIKLQGGSFSLTQTTASRSLALDPKIQVSNIKEVKDCLLRHLILVHHPRITFSLTDTQLSLRIG